MITIDLNIDLNIDLKFVLFLIVALSGCYFLYLALKETLFGNVPSSPAAIGRALGIIILGQLVSFYIIWYFCYVLAFLGFNFQDPDFSIVHSIVSVLFVVMAGLLSVRTFEDTKSMNIKIVCVIGLIPQVLITFLNLTSTNIALYLFIPCILLGGYLSKYMPNESLNRDK